MPSIVLYLLKCSMSLGIVWLFYQLLLRRLTFYMMNRWYLLGYAVLSFLLPLIHIVLPDEVVVGNVQLMNYIPVITGSSPATAHATVYTGWDVLLFVLALGILALLVRLLLRWWSLIRIRRSAVLIRDAEMKIYQVDQPIIPFSFGKAVYINPKLHSAEEWEEIILHEYVHVRQRHTVDILVAEFLCIVSWFNPFSWLIRHSIRQNLEFIADRQVLAAGLDRKSYQYHLLRVIGESRYRLANNFNFSSLKKRIIMMNKSKSARLHLVKFLFIVPMLGVLLVAFRDKVSLPAAILHPFRSSPAPVAAVKKETTAATADVIRPRPARISIPRDTTPDGPAVISLRTGTPDSAKPMFIIDEVESSQQAMQQLKPESIEFINIMKIDNAEFGPRAKNGIVLIFTKVYAPVRKNEVLLKDGKKVRLAVAEPTPRSPMPAPPADTAHPTLLRPTGVTDYIIDSVKVGNDIYSGHSTGLVFTDTTQKTVIGKPSDKFLRQALIIVDGVETPYSDLRIDPDNIESVNVFKGDKGKEMYGEKGKNGVLIIKMKKAAASGKASADSTSNKQ